MRSRMMLAFVLASAATIVCVGIAQAQGGAFGGPRPAAPPDLGGVTGWIMLKQAEFYRGLSAAVRAAKADGSAAWGLMSLSFLYGVFHAAGPGHGKAVISSYLLANEATLKRGVLLAALSSAVQAIVAIALVAITAALIGATMRQMSATVRWIEMISYGGIVALGLWLTWVKLRALRDDLGGASDTHVHGPDCGHVVPAPLADVGWRRAAVAVLSVGARPCSGSILVLVFALAQGVFAIGALATGAMALGTALTVSIIATLAVFAKRTAVRIAAATSGRSAAVLHGFELLAAVSVAGFGGLLLVGYIASERLMPF